MYRGEEDLKELEKMERRQDCESDAIKKLLYYSSIKQSLYWYPKYTIRDVLR